MVKTNFRFGNQRRHPINSSLVLLPLIQNFRTSISHTRTNMSALSIKQSIKRNQYQPDVTRFNPSNMKLEHYSVSLVLVLASVSAIVSAQAQSCHMRELDLCAATLVVFTQSPSGLAVTENDLNKQCVYLKEADNCLKNFIRRCATPMQRQMVSFMGEGSNDLLEDYCRPGTDLRKAYLKHATCLNSAQKSHQKTCIKDLQVALEAMTSINADNWQKRIPIGCCAYKRFDKCIGGQVEKRCGKEALDFINLVLKRAFSRMPYMVCRNYKPEVGECAAVLPAAGSAPKGSKSSSVVSRLLSAYTNV